MRRMLLLLLALHVFGCSPKGVIVPTLTEIQAAPKARAVDEPAEKARASTAEIGRSAAVIAAQANGLQARNRRLQLDLDNVIADSDRMRKAETRTKAEMDLLWQRLTDINVRHQDTLKEADVMQGEITRLQELHRTAEQRVALFGQIAKEAEAEAAQNARLLGLAESSRMKSNNQLQEAADELVKVRAERDKLKGRIKLYDTVAFILGGVTVLYLLVRFIGPLVFPGFFAARAAQKVIVN